MDLHTEWLEYRSGSESLPAYLARPARVSAPLPAVLVIMEIWGPDTHIQDVACRLATSGYVAVAPDLYARGGKRPAPLAVERIEAVKAWSESVSRSVWSNRAEREAALTKLPEPQRGQIAETLGVLFDPKRPMDRYTADLRAAVEALHNHPAVRGQRVGAIGFCMGGALSALLACSEASLAADVIYYGASPTAQQAAGVRCPVLGIYGGDDARITDGVPAFAEAMRAAGKSFEYHVYPGAPHAFFNDTRGSYHVHAARDAWARTLGFFAKHLAAA